MLARSRTILAICAILFANCLVTFAQESPRDESGQSGERTPAIPSVLTPQPPIKNTAYYPVTPSERLRWLVTSTIGLPDLVGGSITSALGTAVNHPVEYGPGWRGFGDRFGMRLTGISTGNAMEASIGMIWREDPRYFRAPDERFKQRISNIFKQTYYARRHDGSFHPAYARFIGIFGNNFLSNTWRAQSEAANHDAALRSLEGIAGRVASNAFDEFWPDVKRHVFHRH